MHEGMRRMRFSSLLERQERGEITQEEAADLLGAPRGRSRVGRGDTLQSERTDWPIGAAASACLGARQRWRLSSCSCSTWTSTRILRSSTLTRSWSVDTTTTLATL